MTAVLVIVVVIALPFAVFFFINHPLFHDDPFLRRLARSLAYRCPGCRADTRPYDRAVPTA